MKNPKINSKIIVYDRYRFAIPLKGIVAEISPYNDGIKIRLTESNNHNYPIGSFIWVSKRQLRKQKHTDKEKQK